MPEFVFQTGNIIFQPGDASSEAYLILSGSVEILARSGNGFQLVAQCGAGDIFGEMALIEEKTRFFLARASSPCRVTTLSRNEFVHYLTCNPERCQRYLQSLFSRMRVSSAWGDGADDAEPQPLLVPSVTIRPMTARAAQSIPEGIRSVTRYPFRIGRATEAPDTQNADINDLSIQDIQPFHVSRAHAAIEMTPDGCLIVVDRGSHLGTVVNDQLLRSDSPTRQAKLLSGDNTLVLGGRKSPFQFCLSVG